MTDRFTADLMQQIAAQVDSQLPDGMAFFLMVAPFGSPGIGNYVSNAQRKEAIQMLRETADRLERNEIKQRYRFRT